jgi:hypothetical protein
MLSYPSIHGRSFARRLAQRRLASHAPASRARSRERTLTPGTAGRAFFLTPSTQQVKSGALRSHERRVHADVEARDVLREACRAGLAIGGLVAWASVVFALAG